MRKEFTKADLKDGMVVEYRNGERRIVIDNMLIGKSGFSTLNKFSENLKENEQAEAIDIMKIYIILKARRFESVLNDNNLELIWDREETKRMTVEEMRQKLEELTGEKIEYEPSREEMIRACYAYCKSKQICSEDCVLWQVECCNFRDYSDEKLKQCYEKVMEDGRKE